MKKLKPNSTESPNGLAITVKNIGANQIARNFNDLMNSRKFHTIESKRETLYTPSQRVQTENVSRNETVTPKVEPWTPAEITRDFFSPVYKANKKTQKTSAKVSEQPSLIDVRATALQASAKRANRISSNHDHINVDEQSTLSHRVRPQTTKAGTISGPEMTLSMQGFFQTPPTSTPRLHGARTLKPRANLTARPMTQTKTHTMHASMQIKGKLTESPAFFHTSQHYKLTKNFKNLPDVFTSPRQANDSGAMQFFTQLLETPARRGMSATATRRAIRALPIADIQSQRLPSTVIPLADHDFSNVDSFVQRPDPTNYFKPQTHVKVPDLIKQQLTVNINLDQLSSLLIPLSVETVSKPQTPQKSPKQLQKEEELPDSSEKSPVVTQNQINSEIADQQSSIIVEEKCLQESSPAKSPKHENLTSTHLHKDVITTHYTLPVRATYLPVSSDFVHITVSPDKLALIPFVDTTANILNSIKLQDLQIASGISQEVFSLPQRPDVSEILYMDVLHTINPETPDDFFGDHFDDYADYTRMASEDVKQAVMSRMEFVKYMLKELKSEQEIVKLKNAIEKNDDEDSVQESPEVDRFQIKQLSLVQEAVIDEQVETSTEPEPVQELDCGSTSEQESDWPEDSETEEHVQVYDCRKRRILFECVDHVTMSKVLVKLDTDFDAIIRLKKMSPLYQDRYITNVLPAEYFGDFKEECENLKAKIDERLFNDREKLEVSVLMKKDYYLPYDKRTPVKLNGGRLNRLQQTGHCLEYFPNTRDFFVELANGDCVVTSRLCLCFSEIDSKHELEKRRKQAMTLKKQAFLRLNFERIFVDEMLQLMPLTRQPASLMNGIISRLAIPTKLPELEGQEAQEKAEKRKQKIIQMAKQAEALYCYSQVKSVALVELQRQNPKVACMVTGFQTQRRVKPKVPYYGLAASELNGGPINHFVNKKQAIELLENYSQLGKPCFNRVFAFVQEKKLQVLDSSLCFCIPFDEKTLTKVSAMLGEKKRLLKTKFGSYPQPDLLMLKAQNQLLASYRQTLHDDFLQPIVTNVEDMIWREYPATDGNFNSVVSQQQINPFLSRFFNSLQSFQGGHLFTKLDEEMQRYLIYLVSFAARSLQFKANAESVGLLIDNFSYVLQSKPFATIQVKAFKIKREQTNPEMKPALTKREAILNILHEMKREEARYDLKTIPDIEDLYQELKKVVVNIFGVFTDLKKVEKFIYPNLELKDPYIYISQALIKPAKPDNSPRTDQSEKKPQPLDDVQLKKQQIEFIIDDVIDQSITKIHHLKSYKKYLTMTLENFFFQAKRQIYEDEVIHRLDSEESSSEKEEDLSPLNTNDSKSFFVDEDYVIRKVNKVQLSDIHHQQLYQELRRAADTISTEINGEYDFGLTVVECGKLKRKVTSKVLRLLGDYQKFLQDKFEDLCRENMEINDKIWKNLTSDNRDDIDKTIEQMQYIETLKTSGTVNESWNKLNQINKYKGLLDDMKIMVRQDSFERATQLYAFPQALEAALKTKFVELQRQAGSIKQKIKDQGLEQKQLLYTVGKDFEEFQRIGLIGIDDVIHLTDFRSNMHITNLLAYATEEDQEGKGGVVWDNNFVDDYVVKINALKVRLDQCEEEIRLTNTREEQLKVQQTAFPELNNVKRFTTPIIKLWQVIEEFNKKHFQEWRVKTLAQLNVDEIETDLRNWLQLTTIANKSELSRKKGPKMFIKFIFGAIERLKQYMPALLALKVKGLERRHFYQIKEETGADILMTQMTFSQLKKMDIHSGVNLERIKQISEAAAVEYQIRVTLEAIEAEVNRSEIVILPFKDTGSFVIKGLDDLLPAMDECQLKLTTIHNNQYAKFFKEQTDKLEKDIRQTIAFFTTWKDLQKYWSYLLPIFANQDIHTQMPDEQRLFYQLDAEYREVMFWAKYNAKTYKMFREKEGSLAMAKRLVGSFEFLKQALMMYLEAKRQYFPRLYFLSNEQIIEIITMVDDVFMLQRNMFKMFEGITELKIIYRGSVKTRIQEAMKILQVKKTAVNPYLGLAPSNKADHEPQTPATPAITKAMTVFVQQTREKMENLAAKYEGVAPEIYGIKNAGNEEIIFNETVTLTHNIEHWLKQLESTIRDTVAETMRNTYLNLDVEMKHSSIEGFMTWIKKWPTQFLLVSLEVTFQHKISVFLIRCEQIQQDLRVKKKELNNRRLITKPLTQDRRASYLQTSYHEDLDDMVGRDERDKWRNFFKRINQQIANEILQLTELVKGQLDKDLRQKVINLLITRVHHRETVEKLQESNPTTASLFLWKLFMKFDCIAFGQDQYNRYLESAFKRQSAKIFKAEDKDGVPMIDKMENALKIKYSSLIKQSKDDLPKHLEHAQGTLFNPYANESLETQSCQVRINIITAKKPYGFEFLENSQRLVITPLTERAFQALFLAMHYDFGGAPVGPVGTGKTETIKEMARRCARPCYILNCSNEFDFDTLSKFFIGLAASGTWTCFDEFNRLSIETLSIISQLIIQIQEAKQTKLNQFIMEGTEVKLNKECALFITLNPFYVGRTQLPDNLKSLFRNITMVVPDSMLIAEILLYSSGFVDAKILAQKIQRTFNLAREQLSNEKHYDFGLRTIKEVLLYAQQIKLRALKVKTNDMIELEEAKEALDNYTLLIKRPVMKQQQSMMVKLGNPLMSIDPFEQAPLQRKRNGSISSNLQLGQRLGRMDPRQSVKERPKPKEIPTPVPVQVEASPEKKEEEESETISQAMWKQFSQVLGISHLDIESIMPGVMTPEAASPEPRKETPQKQQMPTQEREASSKRVETELEVVNEEVKQEIESLESSSFMSSDSSNYGKQKSKPVVHDKKRSQEKDSDFRSSNQDSNSDSNISDLYVRQPSKMPQVIDTDYIVDVLGYNLFKSSSDGEQLEEFIVLKAILDKNLPKMVQNDTDVFKNILMDVFPTTPFPKSAFSQIKEVARSTLGSHYLHDGEDFVQNVTNLYQAIMGRHGVMIVGDPMAGKTKCLQMLIETMNSIHTSEMNALQIKFLALKAKKLGIPTKEENGVEVPVPDGPKQEIMMRLKEEEKTLLKRNCRFKGIDNRVLNPKSINHRGLMGIYDEMKRDWSDGVLTSHFRNASLDKSGRKQLLTFDGTIDPDWVENLNTVLDDNMRLTLSTGESIFLTPQMTVVLETADLRETSPATISRCAVVYFRLESLPLKAKFNTWLKDLPVILKDQAERIDCFVNFLMSEIMDQFLNKTYLIYPVSRHWALSNFIQIFDTLITDYRSDEHREFCINHGGKKKTPNFSPESKKDKGDFEVTAQDVVQETVAKMEQEIAERVEPESQTAKNIVLARKLSKKMSAIIEKQFQVTNKERDAMSVPPPDNNFFDSMVVLANSIKNRQEWVDAFLIQSLVVSVGSLLNSKGKALFDQFIRETVTNCTFANSPVGSPNHSAESPEFSYEKLAKTNYTPTETFLKGSFQQFQLSLPSQGTLFEYFFDVGSQTWQNWELVYNYTIQQRAETTFKNVYQLHVDTIDCLKYKFLLQRGNQAKQNLILIGPTAVGKSWLIKNFMSENQSDNAWKFKMVSCSHMTTGQSFTANMEQDLLQSNRILKPQNDKNLLVFIDDINLPQADKYGSQSLSEILRQWFDYGGWFNLKPVYFKSVKDVTFVSTLSVRDAYQEQLSRRFEWHWTAVGFQNEPGSHLEKIFQQILHKTVINYWKPELQLYAAAKIQEATFVFYREYNLRLKNTPKLFLQKLNQRHCFQIINSMTDIFPMSLRKEEHVGHLWLSEVSRTVLDRYEPGSEKNEVYELAKKVCSQVFKIYSGKLASSPEETRYSYCLPDYEPRTYIQLPDDGQKKLTSLLNDLILDYNKSHLKNSIDMVLFDTIIHKTVKINRSLHLSNATSILVSQEGTGSSTIVKLAIHMASFIGQELLHPSQRESGKEDYKSELKQILTFAMTESTKLVVLNIYEADMVQQGLLEDLNAIAAHGELTELFNQEEIENFVTHENFTLSQTMSEEKTREQVLAMFRQKCRENLKIFIQIPPRSKILSQRLRSFTHLINCACVIQFTEWSKEGFASIGKKYIIEQQVGCGQVLDKGEEVIKQMISMYYDSCNAAHGYFAETCHMVHIQAMHFENFCFVYNDIYSKRMNDLSAYKQRFERGVEGILSTESSINAIQERLSRESPKLIETQIFLEKKLDEYNLKKFFYEQRVKAISAEEADLRYQVEEAGRIKDSCEANLVKVIPLLNDAVEGLLLIKKEEIDEIKSYKNPVASLRTLMQAVCVILRVPPVVKDNKEDYWFASLGPQVLGDPKLIQKLTNLDPKTLDADIIETVNKLMETDELKPENVRQASTAAYGINQWLRAVRDYFFVYRTSVPTRDKTIMAELQYRKVEKALSDKVEEVKQLAVDVEKLKKKYNQKELEIKNVLKRIDDTFIMRSKAARLLNALVREKQKFVSFESVAIHKLHHIEGDVLVAAAMVCFLAPFSLSYRNALLGKWIKEIAAHGIKISKDFDFNQQFGDPITIKKWVENGLPNDDYSIQNAVVLQMSQIQCVMIDPQGMANKWIRKQQPNIMLVSVETQHYLSELTIALSLGKDVLFEVGDEISRKLYPILKISRFDQGKSRTVIIESQLFTVHQDFRVYVTSHSQAGDFGSELSLICNFINFSVTQEAFTQQVVTVILEEMESTLNNDVMQCRKQTLEKLEELRQIEEDILETLREGQQGEELVTSLSLIERLQESRTCSRQIVIALNQIDTQLKLISEKTSLFMPAALRIKQFYFLSQELHKLNHMYVYSHEWFFMLLQNVLKELSNKRSTVSNKAAWIMNEFTKHFFREVCPTLFEKDKVIFSFLMAYKVVQIESDIDMKLLEFFIKGQLQEDLTDPVKPVSSDRKQKVPWINETQWAALDKLSQIAPFDQKTNNTLCRNLSHHVETHPEEWRVWITKMAKYDTPDRDMEYIWQVEDEEMKDQSVMQVNSYKPSNMSSDESDDTSDEEKDVKVLNTKFFNKRIEHQRKLGTLIPNGYEENKIAGKTKQNMQGMPLMSRLRIGLRRLVGTAIEQLEEEAALEKAFCYDLDSDNNNSQESEREEEFELQMAMNNTQEEDRLIARTIIDGFASKTVHVPRKQNLRQAKKRFRIQLIMESDLRKLCLMRCFKPSMVMQEIRNFVAKFLGSMYNDPPGLNWSTLIAQMKQNQPTLLTLGPNINPYSELKAAKANFTGLVAATEVIYQPVGRISNEKIARQLVQAACTGQWLMFDNLHLQLELLPGMRKFFEIMLSCGQTVTKEITQKVTQYFNENFVKRRLAEERQKVIMAKQKQLERAGTKSTFVVTLRNSNMKDENFDSHKLINFVANFQPIV